MCQFFFAHPACKRTLLVKDFTLRPSLSIRKMATRAMRLWYCPFGRYLRHITLKIPNLFRLHPKLLFVQVRTSQKHASRSVDRAGILLVYSFEADFMSKARSSLLLPYHCQPVKINTAVGYVFGSYSSTPFLKFRSV